MLPTLISFRLTLSYFATLELRSIVDSFFAVQQKSYSASYLSLIGNGFLTIEGKKKKKKPLTIAPNNKKKKKKVKNTNKHWLFYSTY